MDKKVIFAVAGSGKTTLIIDSLNEITNSIVITYTNTNYENLREKIIQKFTYFPSNIRLYTYFTFLHSFCYKPFCSDELETKGINFISQPNQFAKKESREHYIDKNQRLYSARITKLILHFKIIDEVVSRISKYFECLYIDEVQDFAANDFNFIKALPKANVQILFVGDFYQHTFDTSRDGNINSSLHDDYAKYQKHFLDSGLVIDLTTLIKSWRCNKTICDFISSKLKIPIQSNRTDIGLIKDITTPEEASDMIQNNSIIKLFYREHYKFNCYSKNWGESKGEDKYIDVCVVLNKTSYKAYKDDKLDELAPSTLNKLYVAISRTRNNLYFVSEEYFKKVS